MIPEIVIVVESQLVNYMADVLQTTYTNFAETSRCQELMENATIISVVLSAPIPSQVFVIEKGKRWLYVESSSEFVGFREITEEDFVAQFGWEMMEHIISQ